MIIPDVQMAINKVNNLGFTAFFNMIKDGRLNVVTAIINDKIVPNCAPFASNASATGIVPKISAYIGIPTSVAKTTPNGLLLPKILFYRSTISFQILILCIVCSNYISFYRLLPS